MSRALRALLLVVGLCGHVMLQAVPAWNSIHKAPSGRDFASYYYALQVAADGGNPYDTAAMEQVARGEHTRKQVHPFFYPPPFLAVVGWAKPLSLFAAYKASFWLNETALFGCLSIGVFYFGVPLWAVVALLWTWSPIPDNMWMGQANLWALFPALAGLALAERGRLKSGGVLVGLAAMLKMSPALFLLYWLIRRRWMAVGAAAVTAVVLSATMLPLVDLAAQKELYLTIPPGFSAGDYHGLSVPISLPANHSIPDLFDRAFPSSGRLLSDNARHASSLVALVLLAKWAWFAHKARSPNAALGALTVLMVAIPVYTYEHHLVFLLVAVGIAAGGVQAVAAEDWQAGRRNRAAMWWITLLLAWFFLAWPLGWLRGAQAEFPDGWGWAFRESKTMAEGAFFLLLLALSRRNSLSCAGRTAPHPDVAGARAPAAAEHRPYQSDQVPPAAQP